MTATRVTRQTPTTKAPGPPLYTSPSTLISASALLSGAHSITLDSNVIIQLRARLSSTYGPIFIGEGTIISEHASIGFLTASASGPQGEQGRNGATAAVGGVNIGPGVVIESGAVVEASRVGAFTTIEAGAIVRKEAVVGERCKICAKVEVGEGCVVEDGMVVWGSGWGKWRAETRARELDGKKESWVKEKGKVTRRVWTGK